jgi:hypothetical protein
MALHFGDELMNSGQALALASQSCTHCYGLGTRLGRNGKRPTCNCVWRAVFRACYARFRRCAQTEKHVSRVNLGSVTARQRKQVWEMPNEEFAADFTLIARRELHGDEWRLFNYHFLLGADWKLCCRKLGIERGAFFHEVYRIQQKLGCAYAEMQPYALFPLDEYFGGTVRGALRPLPISAGECDTLSTSHADRGGATAARRPLRAPIALAAA